MTLDRRTIELDARIERWCQNDRSAPQTLTRLLRLHMQNEARHAIQESLFLVENIAIYTRGRDGMIVVVPLET